MLKPTIFHDNVIICLKQISDFFSKDIKKLWNQDKGASLHAQKFMVCKVLVDWMVSLAYNELKSICKYWTNANVGFAQKLMEDKVVLQKRRETFKKTMQYLTSKYEGLKAQLNENETFAQVR